MVLIDAPILVEVQADPQIDALSADAGAGHCLCLF